VGTQENSPVTLSYVFVGVGDEIITLAPKSRKMELAFWRYVV
jgi:hypothetical protein